MEVLQIARNLQSGAVGSFVSLPRPDGVRYQNVSAQKQRQKVGLRGQSLNLGFEKSSGQCSSLTTRYRLPPCSDGGCNPN